MLAQFTTLRGKGKQVQRVQSRDSAMSFTKDLKLQEGFSTSLEDKIENIKIDGLIIK
jgi:hypothetical protein